MGSCSIGEKDGLEFLSDFTLLTAALQHTSECDQGSI